MCRRSRQGLVTLANWQDPPFNRWAFQHIRELIPTARISRGTGRPRRLPRAERDLSGLRFRSGDRELTVGEMLAETYTDGFLVLHRGRIITEQYFNGMAPRHAAPAHVGVQVGRRVGGRGARAAGAAGRLGAGREDRPGAGRHLVRGRDRSAPAGHACRHALRRVVRQPGGRRADLRAGVPVASGRRVGRARPMPCSITRRCTTTASTAARSGTGRSSPTSSAGCWRRPAAHACTT